jgi:hypothetical protein
MLRLQANLAYLAAIADKSHKPGAQAPTHPAILTAPLLEPHNISTPIPSPKKEDADEKKDTSIPTEDRGERIETLKTQYKKLQEMFPDVDPKKEAQSAQAAVVTKQAGGGGVDVSAQQKLQNDQMRQKMMQQAQARIPTQGQQAR